MDLEQLEDLTFAERDYGDSITREAFSKFYERHAGWLSKRIYGTGVCQLLGSGDVVQDVVQETLSRAYEEASTFSPGFVTDPSRLKASVRG